MAESIDSDMATVLAVLAEAPRNTFVNGPTLQDQTGLDPDRLNDAVALLADEGFAERDQVFGTAPFDFGEVSITPQGRRQHAATSIEQSARVQAPAGEQDRSESAVSDIRVFISHSSRDAELVSRLINLLRAALRLSATEIRCTSVDGYRLYAGAPTQQELRQEIRAAEAFLGIISRDSLRSSFVLFELGARWGIERHLIPLLGPDFPSDSLPPPLNDLNALSLSRESHLHQLIDDLAKRTLGINVEPTSAFLEQLKAVETFRPGPKAEPQYREQRREDAGDTHLETVEVEILQLLANTPEGDNLDAQSIADRVSYPVARTKYFLDQLESNESIGVLRHVGLPSQYYLKPLGRKQLFDLKLL